MAKAPIKPATVRTVDVGDHQFIVTFNTRTVMAIERAVGMSIFEIGAMIQTAAIAPVTTRVGLFMQLLVGSLEHATWIMKAGLERPSHVTMEWIEDQVGCDNALVVARPAATGVMEFLERMDAAAPPSVQPTPVPEAGPVERPTLAGSGPSPSPAASLAATSGTAGPKN